MAIKTYFHAAKIPAKIAVGLQRYGMDDVKVIYSPIRKASIGLSILEQREVFKAIMYAKKLF